MGLLRPKGNEMSYQSYVVRGTTMDGSYRRRGQCTDNALPVFLPGSRVSEHRSTITTTMHRVKVPGVLTLAHDERCCLPRPNAFQR